MKDDFLDQPALTAPYVLEYAYKRTLGPVLSAFYTGLRDKKLFGIQSADGRVLMPPQEYDPNTGESLSNVVQVQDSGVVQTWSWVQLPRSRHPSKKPFAWALILLNGADTSFLHIVDVDSKEKMRAKMPVAAKWAKNRVGYITDIASFVPIEVGVGND